VTEMMSKDDRKLLDKAKVALKAEQLGYVEEEWLPSPFKHLDLSGCKMAGLSLSLIVGGNSSFYSGVAFEKKRMEEIMAESDSSSEEVQYDV
jgi:hypothetical protein